MFSNAAWQLAANEPRQADDLLAPDRVALVRHRRRALLALGERLLDLADLGLLEAADLERELLERRGGDGERRQQFGVAIALDDLRRHRRRLEAEPPRRRRPRSTAAGARTCRPHPTACRRDDRARARARARCPAPTSAYQSASFSPNVIGSACTPCVRPIIGVRRCSKARSRIASASASRSCEDDVARLAHLQRLRRVDDVRRGHAEVQPAGRRPDLLGHGRRERDDVVLGDLFDFLDAGDVEGAALADVAGGLRRDDAGGGHGVGRGGFHEQPGLVPTLVAPDAAHFRVCVALESSRDSYCKSSRSRGICKSVHVARAPSPTANRP